MSDRAGRSRTRRFVSDGTLSILTVYPRYLVLVYVAGPVGTYPVNGRAIAIDDTIDQNGRKHSLLFISVEGSYHSYMHARNNQ